MNPALQKYLEAASGWTTLTAKKAEQVVKQMVRSGEAASDQVGEMVEELLERQRGNREAVTALVRSESTRAVRGMGLATSSEVERLQRQVADLKREVQRLELETGAIGSQSPAGAGATRTPAKKSAKKSTKKTTSKKTGSKKSAAKKSTKKATSKKTGSKKSAAKKSTKKSAAKKSAKKATKKSTGGGSS